MPSNFNRSRDGLITPDGVEVYGRNPYDTTQATSVVYRTNAKTLIVNGVEMTAERFVWLRNLGCLLDAASNGNRITTRLTGIGAMVWHLVERGDWQAVQQKLKENLQSLPYQTDAVQKRLAEIEEMQAT